MTKAELLAKLERFEDTDELVFAQYYTDRDGWRDTREFNIDVVMTKKEARGKA